jgi:hypothetical protein
VTSDGTPTGPPPPQGLIDVFVSYAREDRETAAQLA